MSVAIKRLRVFENWLFESAKHIERMIELICKKTLICYNNFVIMFYELTTCITVTTSCCREKTTANSSLTIVFFNTTIMTSTTATLKVTSPTTVHPWTYFWRWLAWCGWRTRRTRRTTCSLHNWSETVII